MEGGIVQWDVLIILNHSVIQDLSLVNDLVSVKRTFNSSNAHLESLCQLLLKFRIFCLFIKFLLLFNCLKSSLKEVCTIFLLESFFYLLKFTVTNWRSINSRIIRWCWSIWRIIFTSPPKWCSPVVWWQIMIVIHFPIKYTLHLSLLILNPFVMCLNYGRTFFSASYVFKKLNLFSVKLSL